VNDAVHCIGICSGRLGWGHYYALFRRFLNAIAKKPHLEKTLIRLIAQILNHFHFSLDGTVSETLDSNEIGNEDEEEEDVEQIEKISDSARIHAVVVNKMLPELHKYLSTKNDETVSTRIPIALAIAKLLKQLPSESMHLQLPKLLSTLVNLLRSHLQDARDSSRNTIVQIALLLGPKYLKFISTRFSDVIKTNNIKAE
jgi:U3 small nucleolar RNA-associated protein 20